jgi:hypothetical protein
LIDAFCQYSLMTGGRDVSGHPLGDACLVPHPSYYSRGIVMYRVVANGPGRAPRSQLRSFIGGAIATQARDAFCSSFHRAGETDSRCTSTNGTESPTYECEVHSVGGAILAVILS